MPTLIRTIRTVRTVFRRVTLSRKMVEVYDRFSSDQTFGQRGETAAERYLLRHGLIIVARGFQNNFGEIDLIAVDDETVVFVEVKTRASNEFGSPAEAVDDSKQEKLSKTALAYLHKHKLLEYRVRFDIVAVTWPKDQKHPEIEHFENAFEIVGEGQMFS